MKPIHIAFDAQLSLLENSLSRYTRNLVQQLALLAPELKLSLLVFSPRNSADLRKEHSWIPPQAELHTLPGKETPYGLSKWENFRRYYLALASKTRAIGADIFQAHYGHFPLPHGFFVVTVVHDVFQWKKELGRATRAWDPVRRLVDRWLYRQATLVCVSDSTLNDFRHCLDAGHPDIQRVHSGNDPVFNAIKAPQDQEFLERYGLKSGRYFLYVGDLTPRKGVPTLVTAFRNLLPDLPPDFRLALTKGHWEVCVERDMVSQWGLQDRVTFLGDVPGAHLPALYRNCFAFVFPSLYEGFGFPPLEAMACGVPTIVSRNSSLPEITGDAGLNFQAGDAGTLARLMLQLLNDAELRSTCIRRGLVQSARFCWRKTAEEYLKIYTRLAKAGKCC